MEYLGGSTKDHDAEVDDASWFPLDTALAKVSYKGDKKIVEKAKEMLNTTVTLLGSIPLNKGGQRGLCFFPVRYNPLTPFSKGNFRYLMRRLKSDAVVLRRRCLKLLADS